MRSASGLVTCSRSRRVSVASAESRAYPVSEYSAGSPRSSSASTSDAALSAVVRSVTASASGSRAGRRGVAGVVGVDGVVGSTGAPRAEVAGAAAECHQVAGADPPPRPGQQAGERVRGGGIVQHAQRRHHVLHFRHGQQPAEPDHLARDAARVKRPAQRHEL